MRLWHYKLLSFLPNSQLLAQKRECDLIWKDISNEKETNHILINYIWQYGDPVKELAIYYRLLEKEFLRRGFKFNFHKSAALWLDETRMIPFEEDHDFIYLRQCYYNLEEKFARGQKDFEMGKWLELYDFYKMEEEKYNEWKVLEDA